MTTTDDATPVGDPGVDREPIEPDQLDLVAAGGDMDAYYDYHGDHPIGPDGDTWAGSIVSDG